MIRLAKLNMFSSKEACRVDEQSEWAQELFQMIEDHKRENAQLYEILDTCNHVMEIYKVTREIYEMTYPLTPNSQK